MRRQQKARRANGACRVFLDTKYWIRLRNHLLHRTDDPGARAIYDALSLGAQAGLLVIPVTDSLVVELLRQGDPASRTFTASLVDLLTDGIALVGYEYRVALEFRHWLTKNDALCPSELVWTGVMHVLGDMHFRTGFLSDEDENMLAKANHDLGDHVRLRDMVAALPANTASASRMASVVAALNTNKNSAHDPTRAFDQLLDLKQANEAG
jgi:hypothetical protein